MKVCLLIVSLCLLSSVTWAQTTFTADATVTVSRRSPTDQADASQKLARDIERYVRAFYPNVGAPTAKNQAGVCQPFTVTDTKGRNVDVDVYNRDANTCAVVIQPNGKTDLIGLNGLVTRLERVWRIHFNTVTDGAVVAEVKAAADVTATAELNNRKADKP